MCVYISSSLRDEVNAKDARSTSFVPTCQRWRTFSTRHRLRRCRIVVARREFAAGAVRVWVQIVLMLLAAVVMMAVVVAAVR